MRTRSQKKKQAAKDSSNQESNAEIAYYSTVSDKNQSNKIQVISKRKFKNTQENHQILKEKFEAIEKKRLAKEKQIQETETQTTSGDNNFNYVIYITHFNVFMYAACFFIQVGTLPYLAKKLGADPKVFGYLQTVFAIAQLFGNPIFGRIGDVIGNKSAMCLAFFSSALTYLIMGISHNISLLFLSRLPSIFMHVMQGAQMTITSLTNEQYRAQSLSRLGFSYGLGMVGGPILGGHVTKHFGEQNAAFVAALGSLLSLFLTYVFIPSNIETKTNTKENKTSKVLDIKAIFKILLLPKAGFILFIKLLCGIPIGVLQSMFSVIAMESFKMTPEQNGMMLSYIGIISIFMQGIGISLMTKLFREKSLLLGSTLMLSITYYFLYYVYDVTSFMMVLFPLTCALCLCNSVLTSSATKTVASNQTGTMLGLNMAIHSAIRSLSPTIGGYLFHGYGMESLGILGITCNVLTLTLILTLSNPFDSL